MSLENQYIVGLGSNLGDRAHHLTQAVSNLAAQLGQIVAQAPLYATAPIGAADQTFLNSAVLCSSTLQPAQALTCLLAIEHQMGRIRTQRWGNRVIDLDILLWSGGSFVTPELVIPHPQLLARDFALVPAADLAPNWQHPLSGLALKDEVHRRNYALTPFRLTPLSTDPA